MSFISFFLNQKKGERKRWLTNVKSEFQTEREERVGSQVRELRRKREKTNDFSLKGQTSLNLKNTATTIEVSRFILLLSFLSFWKYHFWSKWMVMVNINLFHFHRYMIMIYKFVQLFDFLDLGMSYFFLGILRISFIAILLAILFRFQFWCVYCA